METNIDNKKNEDFLEILQNKEGLISKVDQKVLFITKMAFYEHTIVGKQDLSEKEVESLISKYFKNNK